MAPELETQALISISKGALEALKESCSSHLEIIFCRSIQRGKIGTHETAASILLILPGALEMTFHLVPVVCTLSELDSKQLQARTNPM